MTFKSEFSPKAKNDANSIFDYIKYNLYSPIAAKNFVVALKRKVKLIEENPYIYALSKNDKMAADGCRSVVIGNYIMLYEIDEDNKIVKIIRIIYGKRNIPVIYDEYDEI